MGEEPQPKRVDPETNEVPDLRPAGYTFYEPSESAQQKLVAESADSVDATQSGELSI